MDELPIVTRLRSLHVWPQSTADTYPDVLGPRRIKALYEVGEVAHEAADVIAALVDALLGAEGAIQAMGSQVDAEWRDHDKAATRHDSTVRAWRAKRDAALAKAGATQ